MVPRPSQPLTVPAAAAPRPSAASIALTGGGTFLALALIGGLAAWSRQPLILGSFGASCVLLFGFPQGPFSQPRHIVGGHLLSALVGLVFLNAFGPGWLPMAAATGCAASLMLWTRTVHPPAGSNPVIIFIGGPTWSFLASPTALGALLLVAIGWCYWKVRSRGTWPVRWW